MTLPQGWIGAKLGELSSKIGSGATPRGGREAYGAEGTPLIRSMNVHFDGFRSDGLAFIDDRQAHALANVVVDANDVLLNITGASIGRVCLAPDGMVKARVNQHVCIIRLIEVEQRFIQAFLAAPEMQRFVLEENYGLTRQALTKGMIEDIAVPLPPLAEQRRIVAKLDALTARLARAQAELDRVLVLAERLRSAALEAAFSTLAPTRSMSEVSSRITKGSSPRWQGYDYQSEGVLFVRSQNVRWGKLALDDQAFLPPSFNQKARNSVIHEGDVLLNIVGASIGRAAVASSEVAGGNCNQAVCIIRPNEPADAKYLMFYLISPLAQAAITEGAVDVARANFSLAQAKSLNLPWPDDGGRRVTVEKIEQAFARADRLEAEATRARELLDRLESAVLAKAFRGELVPQDPTDEPAQTLLDRIRTERAAAPKAQRGRKAKAVA